MSVFSFISAAGQKFKISGPDGLSLDQAKKIFDTQDSTGSLVGLKPGSILSAATQAAAGLKSALSSLTQGISGITGALGAGISSAAGAIGSVASGLGDKVASFTQTAVKTLTNSVASTTPSAGIDIANFAKQDTALGPVAGLSTSQVTGVLAQAKNLVDQPASVMTDTKGVGSYGLSIDQLERAGYVKPGISQIANATGAPPTDILNSAKAFTGKDGVTSVDSLLANPMKQAAIQQDLMTKGVADLAASTGLNVNALPANLQAGVALTSADSVSAAKDLLGGVPVPGDLKANFDNVVSNASFAVNFTDLKVPNPFKEVEVPVPAAGTVNRATLTAATNRLIGSDKIPKPDFTGLPSAAIPAAGGALNAANNLLSSVTNTASGVLGAANSAADSVVSSVTGTANGLLERAKNTATTIIG